MKIAFFGSNEFGEIVLERIIRNKIKVELVIIPLKNRTKKIFKLCKRKKIDLIKYQNCEEIITELTLKKIDLIVISSFPKIFPEKLFNLPKYGSINVHPSLLPKYRGCHPIHWAIINNEKETGATIHYVTEEVDGGDIIFQEAIKIIDSDNINSLLNKQAVLGADLITKAIKLIAKNKRRIRAQKQNKNEITFASKRTPDQGRIDWNKNSREIFNLIRSLERPYPNAFAFTSTNKKIEFEKVFVSRKHGKVLGKIKGYYIISTSDGVLMIYSKNKLKIGEVLK